MQYVLENLLALMDTQRYTTAHAELCSTTSYKVDMVVYASMFATL